jgi:hypothetical protein
MALVCARCGTNNENMEKRCVKCLSSLAGVVETMPQSKTKSLLTGSQNGVNLFGVPSILLLIVAVPCMFYIKSSGRSVYGYSDAFWAWLIVLSVFVLSGYGAFVRKEVKRKGLCRFSFIICGLFLLMTVSRLILK